MAAVVRSICPQPLLGGATIVASVRLTRTGDAGAGWDVLGVDTGGHADAVPRPAWTGPRRLTVSVRSRAYLQVLRREVEDVAVAVVVRPDGADAALPAADPPGMTAPAPAASFIYCADAPTPRILAGRVLPDGRLRFGLSVWSAARRNLSLFGTAAPDGSGWTYAHGLAAASPAVRCRLSIRSDDAGGMTVVADPDATCTEGQGAGVTIGSIAFPARAREGAVTHELDGPEEFQHAGRCTGG